MKRIERVHIIPLGFERSIAVNPIKALGGKRAHIVTIGGEFAEKYDLWEEQRYFEETVFKDLEALGLDVEVHYADLFDFKEAVKKIAGITLMEKSKGSEIYLNLSSHGRLVSVASALVGWYHGIRMYYVLADRYAKDIEELRLYGRSVCEDRVILEVPQIEVVKLSDEERFALSLIFSNGKRYAKLGDIAEKFCYKFPEIYMCKKGDRGKLTWKGKQELLTKLNRRVLSKLESKGYIEREKVGRNTVLRITDEGEIFALLAEQEKSE